MLNLMLNGPDDEEEEGGWSSILAAAGFLPPPAEEVGEVEEEADLDADADAADAITGRRLMMPPWTPAQQRRRGPTMPPRSLPLRPHTLP